MMECEDKNYRLKDDKQQGQTTAGIVDNNEKRTVEEVGEKSLKDRDSEGKEQQNRRKNSTIFELLESKKSEQDDSEEEDVKKDM